MVWAENTRLSDADLVKILALADTLHYITTFLTLKVSAK